MQLTFLQRVCYKGTPTMSLLLAKNSRESWPEKHDKYLLQSTDCCSCCCYCISCSLLQCLRIWCNPFAHAWMPLSQRELLNGAKRPVVPADAVSSVLTQVLPVQIVADKYRSGLARRTTPTWALREEGKKKQNTDKRKWKSAKHNSSAFYALVARFEKKSNRKMFKNVKGLCEWEVQRALKGCITSLRIN